MAGSFNHCDDHGVFGMELIENMGDAEEALEMMHFMIWYLARFDHVAVKEAVEAFYESRRR